jgi:hypothetical protein
MFVRNTTARSEIIHGQHTSRPHAGLAALLLAAAMLLLTACSEQRPAATVPALPTAASAPSRTPTAAPTPIPPTPTPPAPLAALVDGEYVFLADYEERVAQYEQALLAQGLDPATEEGKTRLAAAREEVLDGLINGVLIQKKAAGLGITLADEEIEAQVAADIEGGGGQGSFTEWLSATGQTRDDYKASLYEAMLWQKVMDAVVGQVPATAEQVHARLIVVDTREAADGVQAQLQSGADFAQLARELSLDEATRENGGDLGWFPRGLIDQELEDVAFSLQPGEIAGPLEIAQGFRFVQVTEREQGRAIAPEMQLDLKRVTFERWLEEQRRAAHIEQFVDTGSN